MCRSIHSGCGGVLRTLRVGSSEAALGAQRPGGPRRLRRGSPAFFGRKPEERTPGASPWTPVFMARLLPLARFGVCATLSRWRGYYGTHVRALIWRLSFIKCFFSIFFPENAFQIGLRIPEEIAPRTDEGQQPPKRASGNERALKQGGGGGPPPATLCVRAFSRESLDPPPGTGRGTTSQVPTCAGPNPDPLPTANQPPGPTRGRLFT